MVSFKRRNILKARKLRREMSLPEVLLWRELRRAHLKFRRQHPVSGYVLDFYCASAKSAIEIDGIAHEMGNRPQHDLERDQALHGKGIRVIRVPAKDVLRDAVVVAEHVVKMCDHGA